MDSRFVSTKRCFVMKIFSKNMCIASVTSVLFLGLSAATSATNFTGDAYRITAYNAPAGAISMRLGGPQGFVAESDSLTYDSFYPLPDGTYSFEITGALTGVREGDSYDAKNSMNNGRDFDAASYRGFVSGIMDSGYFSIVGGTVLIPNRNDVEDQ